MPEAPRADSPCPELAELFLAREGELPKRRQHEVSTHIRHCPICRETLGRADRSLADFQDAHETPQRIAAEATAAAERTGEFRVRLHEEQRMTVANATRFPVRTWLPVAAAVPVLVAALFFSNRYGVVVRAEELLTRAVAQEESAPIGTVRRLDIRVRRTSRSWSLTREVSGQTMPRGVVPASASSENEQLATMFEANHFDWRDPLSVRAFRAWRDSLTNKTDTVTLLDSDTLALRTTTPDGVLRSAVLIVRRVDFQPIKQTLTFEGFGEVEIIELSRWIRSAATMAENGAPSTPAAETAAPTADTLDEAELDVRRTLHDLAVDWNPAITINRSDSAVIVRGRIDAQNKAAITHALNRLGPVRVLLRTTSDPMPSTSVDDGTSSSVAPAPVTTGAELSPPSAGDTAAGSRAPSVLPLQRWLERTFGRSERSGTFIPALTASAEQVRRRSAAFDQLAQRYPESETRRLSDPVKKKLDALADAQYRELVKAVQMLDDRLALFLGTPTRSTAAESAPRPWQGCATALTNHVERLDQALDAVLRTSDLPLPTEIGPGHEEPQPLSNLRQAADTLWEQLHAAQSL